MRVPQSTPPPKTTVLLFGPHFLSFDLEHLLHLRSTVNDPQYQWIHTAVSELPGWWDTASQALPILKAVPGSAILCIWDDSFKPDQPELSWCHVNDIAATLSELLLTQEPAYSIYHVENPTRQSWPEMITMLADYMGIPRQHIIPFEQWLERMRQNTEEKENPARRVEEFLDDHFIRMACGGVIMDTEMTRERSLRLRTKGAIEIEVIRKYIGVWKEVGLLH